MSGWAIAFFWLAGTVLVTLWAHLSQRTTWQVGLLGCLLCSPVVGALLVGADIATYRDSGTSAGGADGAAGGAD